MNHALKILSEKYESVLNEGKYNPKSVYSNGDAHYNPYSGKSLEVTKIGSDGISITRHVDPDTKDVVWAKTGTIKPNYVLHNPDGPAIIRPNGERVWYLNGVHHRDNGPAFENLTGPTPHYIWYRHGFKHNLDGPAYLRIDKKFGTHKEYWIDGKQVREIDFLSQKNKRDAKRKIDHVLDQKSIQHGIELDIEENAQPDLLSQFEVNKQEVFDFCIKHKVKMLKNSNYGRCFKFTNNENEMFYWMMPEKHTKWRGTTSIYFTLVYPNVNGLYYMDYITWDPIDYARDETLEIAINRRMKDYHAPSLQKQLELKQAKKEFDNKEKEHGIGLDLESSNDHSVDVSEFEISNEQFDRFCHNTKIMNLRSQIDLRSHFTTIKDFCATEEFDSEIVKIYKFIDGHNSPIYFGILKENYDNTLKYFSVWYELGNHSYEFDRFGFVFEDVIRDLNRICDWILDTWGCPKLDQQRQIKRANTELGSASKEHGISLNIESKNVYVDPIVGKTVPPGAILKQDWSTIHTSTVSRSFQVYIVDNQIQYVYPYKAHNLRGPAVIKKDRNTEEYYVYGKQLTKAQFVEFNKLRRKYEAEKREMYKSLNRASRDHNIELDIE